MAGRTSLAGGPLLPVLLLIVSAQVAMSQGSGSATDALTKSEYAKIAKARLQPVLLPGVMPGSANLEVLLARWRGLILDCGKF
jgi:hypothetical protein